MSSKSRPHCHWPDPGDPAVTVVELTLGKAMRISTSKLGRMCAPGDPAWIARVNKTTGAFYAQRQLPIPGHAPGAQRQRTQQAHRFALEIDGHDLTGRLVDHVDHDTLNNVDGNLRPVTPAGNMRNRRDQLDKVSAENGVRWVRPRQKWTAHPYDPSKKRGVYLGLFESEGDAIKTVRQWRTKRSDQTQETQP